METRGARFRRKAHRTGLYLYAFFTVALLVCLVALAIANTTDQVKFSWVVGAWDRYQRGLPLAHAGAAPPLTHLFCGT